MSDAPGIRYYPESTDPEIRAIEVTLLTIRELPVESRGRVIRYVTDRLESEI